MPGDESPNMRREVRVETEERGIRVVRLVGQHDLSSADQVYPALSIGDQSVIIDLTETTFLDSTVLGLIFDFATRHTEAPTRVAVVAVPGSVPDRVITVSGWGRFHDAVYASREEALSALSES
jgi:anti-anti-sigma regulatory factor